MTQREPKVLNPEDHTSDHGRNGLSDPLYPQETAAAVDAHDAQQCAADAHASDEVTPDTSGTQPLSAGSSDEIRADAPSGPADEVGGGLPPEADDETQPETGAALAATDPAGERPNAALSRTSAASQTFRLALVAGVLAGMTAGLGTWGAVSLLGDGSGVGAVSGVGVTDISAIAEQLLPSVYSIYPANGEPNSDRIGTAVVYRADGYLVTNYHVVGGSGQVTLDPGNGETLKGEVIGGHERSDIAVVKVDSALTAPVWSDRQVKVGEPAIVLGSPFGFAGSVTAGIISALDRSAGMVNGSALYGMLQTDASINPGNSGGPLVDVSGNVVGVNTAIYSLNGQWQGVGFAIPTAAVRKVADRLIEEGSFTSGFLGVTTIDSVGPVGAYVAGVFETYPADEAGIEKGDLIIALDGRPVRDVAELSGRIGITPIGSVVEVTVLRDREELTFSVTLAETPDAGTLEQLAQDMQAQIERDRSPSGPGGDDEQEADDGQEADDEQEADASEADDEQEAQS